ncbi:MAG: carboxypeptidase-like regulatory domain-containing protein, partial [Myxococcota bacterium]|nr:carboxypeptidase-like regulatory domain-containing protein [Myxococcota bacterium]
IGPPSASRLVVRSAADAHRADAQTEVPIVRFRGTTVTLAGSRSEVGPGETVELSGTLRSSEGGLARKAVGLWADDRHLGTALTDDDGRFATTLGWEELGTLDGEVIARFESDAPWWGASESPRIALRVETPGGTPWSWIAISLAASALLFGLAGRRRRAGAPPGRAELPIAAPAIELGARKTMRPESSEVTGRVIDARSDVGIAGALVRSRRAHETIAETTTDAHGRFAISLAAGTHAIEIASSGYELARHEATVPHRGEWTSIVVRLRSLRDLAWEPLQPIAARLLPTPDLWGVWTARELERAARARHASPIALPSLIASVERAAYAPEPPSAEDLDAIRRTAQAIDGEMASRSGSEQHGDRSAR